MAGDPSSPSPSVAGARAPRSPRESSDAWAPRIDTLRRHLVFGPFRIDRFQRIVLRDGERVSLPPRAFDLLLALAESGGRVLGRDELIRQVWADAHVIDANLTQTVSVLRRALGEEPKDHRYIVTVPGRGYQFVSRVRVADPDQASVRPPKSPVAEPQGHRTRRWTSWLAIAVLVLIGGGLTGYRPSIDSEISTVELLGTSGLAGEPRLSDQQATQLYMEGLDALQAYDPQRAGELLRRAIGLEPESPLLHAALARVQSLLGQHAAARRSVQRAQELAYSLDREDRLAIEALHRGTRDAWHDAVRLSAALWTFFPDNPEYGLRLAAAQVRNGDVAAAGTTLGELRRLPAPVPSDPRLDLLAAQIAELGGDARISLDAAERAVAAAEQHGARLLLADALVLAGSAYQDQGRNDAAAASFERARATYRALGVPRGAAGSTARLGLLLAARGQPDKAEHELDTALALTRRIGDRHLEAWVLNHLGTLHYGRGQLEKAEATYRQALQISRATDNQLTAADLSSNLGMLAYQRGNDVEAERFYLDALTVYRQIAPERRIGTENNLAILYRDRGALERARLLWEEVLVGAANSGFVRGQAWTLTNIGLVLLDAGDLRQAQQRLQAAESIWQCLESPRGESDTLRALGEVHLAAGHADLARPLFDQAADVAESRGESVAVAIARVRLAQLALDEKAYDTSEHLAKASLDVFRQADELTGSTTALCVLTRVALARDDLAAAEAWLGQIEPQLAATDLRLQRAIARAQLQAAAGRPSDAAATLTGGLALLPADGFPRLRLEAELVRATIEQLAGHAPAALERRAAVAAEAKRLGFGRLERIAG
ncbi:MAG: tetratricopeptide repeat protein [Acidobacteriota bacterium]